MSANKRNVVGLSTMTALGLLAAACDQPAPKCAIARGLFAAKYTLVSGTGDCATLNGETIGVDIYYQPISKSDPQPDTEHGTVAMQPDAITGSIGGAAGFAEPNPEDKPYAFGPFSSVYPTDDFCTIPTLSSARMRLAEVPEHVVEDSDNMCSVTVPAQPAVDLTYTWSNVKVYVTPGAFGTQFAADLTYVKDGCSAQYRVTAVYPSVSCGVAVAAAEPAPATGDPPDSGVVDAAGIDGGDGMDAALDAPDGAGDEEDGGVVEGAECDPPAAQTPDDTACSPVADISKGRATGSGINPEFATVCDPNLLLCVPASAPPSLR